jgi:hypothetical protein
MTAAVVCVATIHSSFAAPSRPVRRSDRSNLIEDGCRCHRDEVLDDQNWSNGSIVLAATAA